MSMAALHCVVATKNVGPNIYYTKINTLHFVDCHFVVHTGGLVGYNVGSRSIVGAYRVLITPTRHASKL